LSRKRKNKQLFCIILTKPENLATRAFAALYVWARKCSDYRFVTIPPDYLSHPDNQTLFKKSSFNLLHPRGLVNESYDELTKKVLYAFRDVYEEVGDQYDWYLKADGLLFCLFYIKHLSQVINLMFLTYIDDTFINFDNLIKWLGDGKDPNDAAIYGQQSLMIDMIKRTFYNMTYMVGGPGYVLSKAAFRKLGSQLVKNMSFCKNTGIEGI
jgi:hypothetical protein